MYEYLVGKVNYKKAEYVALDINGVGYKVFISLRTYEKIETDKEYKFFISEIIKEDSFKLIGFLDEKERKLFDLLLSVKGIGLSLSLAIMSTFSYDKIIDLIREEDYKTLKKVPKLGEKKSQFMIIDLKSKMKKLNSDSCIQFIEKDNDDMEDDIRLALISLGYSNKEVDNIIRKSNINNFTSLEEAIKNILKNIKED